MSRPLATVLHDLGNALQPLLQLAHESQGSFEFDECRNEALDAEVRVRALLGGTPLARPSGGAMNDPTRYTLIIRELETARDTTDPTESILRVSAARLMLDELEANLQRTHDVRDSQRLIDRLAAEDFS